jgi:hypothetical protein
MGNYVYGASRTIVVEGQQIVTFRYLYKPVGWGGNRSEDTAQKRVERHWEHIPESERPELAISSQKPGDEETVFRWKRDRLFWTDCNPFPGEKVGVLKKLRGQWRILPVDPFLRSLRESFPGPRLTKRRLWLQRQIEHQKQWIVEHGGDLDGYIERYGRADDPKHYGAGGEAIYKADTDNLAKLERQLAECI